MTEASKYIKTRSPDVEAIYSEIGQMLMIVQSTEVLVRYVLTFVLQKPGAPLDAARLEEVVPELAHKTLGQLFHELENRADLHPEFKGVVERFLADRNTLAHNLESVGGRRLKTEEGRQEMRDFLGRLLRNCDVTMRVFTSLTLSHARQIDMPIDLSLDPKIKAWIGSYLGIEANTFFAKGSQRWKRGKRGEVLSEQPQDVSDD